MPNNRIPRTPTGLQARGKRFWNTVLSDLEMEPHEHQLLAETCRILDRLEGLDAVVREKGLTTLDGRIAPAVVELRLQQVTLARVVASLRLPDEYRAEVLSRGQRRGSARGTYQLRAVRDA